MTDAALPTRPLVTEAEFLALPETNERIELLDGEVIVSPSPTLRHQRLLIKIVTALETWAQGKAVTVGIAPLDVRFADGRILQPDAFVSLVEEPVDLKGPITRTPEICVEVVSGNRAYDRVTKRYVYAEAGVKEYWIVEASGLVERRFGDYLEQVEEVRHTLTTPLLPGFSLSIAELAR